MVGKKNNGMDSPVVNYCIYIYVSGEIDEVVFVIYESLDHP